MDHVFKGFGFGEAYGLEGDESSSSRDLTLQVGSAGDVADTPVTLHVWDTPNGSRLLVSVSFRCPACQFPLHAPATQVGVTLDDNDGNPSLSMRMPIACSGHWEQVNEYGQTSGRQVKCGWQGCIRENQFHHPRCAGANFRNNGFRGKSSTYWRSDTDWTCATCPNGKKSTGYCNTDLS